MDATDLLDRWKKARNVVTDMAAAEKLGVTRAAVSKWRNGLSRPTAAVIEKMARECGEDWRAAVLRNVADQMESGDRASAATLRRLAQTLAVCLVAVLGAITSSPDLSNAARSNLTESGQAIHYAHRFRGWLRRLAQAFARVKLSVIAA